MNLLRRIAGAVAIGFGMVFASRRRDEHWTEPPIVLVVEAEAPDSTDP